MIWKSLRPPVDVIGNFIFFILYKLANAFENKQHEVKTNKQAKIDFYLHFSSFQKSLIRRGVELCSPDTSSKIAQAHNRWPQWGPFMVTKKSVPTNQSPYKQGKGYFNAFTINATCQPARDSGWNDLYPSHIYFYRWKIIYLTCWKGWVLKIFFLCKTEWGTKKWQLLISLWQNVTYTVKKGRAENGSVYKSHIIKPCHRI